MLKTNLSRAALLIALAAVGISFAQDGAKSEKAPVSVAPTSPLARPEVPANQPPNLYDESSDEFNYFRDELGKEVKSTKQRKRLEQIAKRVVYDDPMDKPADDGSPFVDVYNADEVLSDGKEFQGFDDPDFLYKDDENNFLAKFAKGCDSLASLISQLTGVGAGDGQNRGSGSPSSPQPGPPPGIVMPTVSMDSGVAPGGAPSGSDMAADPKDSGSGSNAKKEVAPSKFDDSKMLFPGEDEANADLGFKGLDLKYAPPETSPFFEWFKADHEFEPKATAGANDGSGYSMGGSEMEMPAPVMKEDK